MNVSCPECGSIFRVDPARVPAGGVRARCSVCGGVMRVDAPDSFVEDGWGAVGRSGARTTPPPAPHSAQPAAPGGLWDRPRPGATPVTPLRVHTPPEPSAGVSTPGGGVGPWQQPPQRWTPAATPARTPPATPAHAPTTGVPLHASVATPPHAPTTPTPRTAPSLPGPAAGAGVPPSSPAGGPAGGGERPPINPFLANDPNQKAKRLARALVSDIVAYHPQLREQGLRDGTLRQLFRDEIKKSYEEYIEQVGKEFAESTAHFQDALNDILAGGRRMF